MFKKLKIKNKFADLNISSKFAIFYTCILISSLLLSNLLYQKIYTEITLDKVSDLSVQNLNSIKSSLDLTINNVNTYSKMILSDNDVQGLLRNGDIYLDLKLQEKVNAYLYKLIQETSNISSVHIFDMHGNELSVNNKSEYIFLPENVEEAGWYDPVVNQRGAYVLRLNGGGVFESSSNSNYISMIRLIRDVNTTKILGILLINISENAFKDININIQNNYQKDILIINEDKENIIKSDIVTFEEKNELLKNTNGLAGYSIKKLSGKRYLSAYLSLDKYKWKIISIMPMEKLSNETSSASIVGFAIIFINSILLLIGSIFISRMLTIPIKKLLSSMKKFEKGEFQGVEIKSGNNEIGRLRDGYNRMVREIQVLIKRIINEQSIMRKLELDALQAQIKPHFLYNTLDSISSLAMLGRIDDVCEMIDSLGIYYRKSLSKGREIITIKEELEMVKSYLKIQQMRYGDKFTVIFDFDSRCNALNIPKLIIQPLVENSIYHGVRLKKGKGIIKVTSQMYKEKINLIIEDNGNGMDKEELTKILSENSNLNKSSFGLVGTIKRLKIFYNSENCFKIESEKEVGTKIVIEIPAENN